MRQMLEKHTLENVDLEDQLNRHKIDQLNKVIEESEEQKKKVKQEIQTQLKDALKKAVPNDDKNVILQR